MPVGHCNNSWISEQICGYHRRDCYLNISSDLRPEFGRFDFTIAIIIWPLTLLTSRLRARSVPVVLSSIDGAGTNDSTLRQASKEPRPKDYCRIYMKFFGLTDKKIIVSVNYSLEQIVSGLSMIDW